MFRGPTVAGDTWIVRGSKVELPFLSHLRCSLASMANALHDTYYLDDRMAVLSVGTFCWIHRQIVKLFFSVAGAYSESLIGS